MDVTVLGSGSPPPQTSRGGQSVLVTVGVDRLLIDCGPLTVERLLESEVPLREIDRLFFSHQHVDHNASFFHFAVASWMYGRRELVVYGPAGTDALLDALGSVYREDIVYRRSFGRPTAGITDVDYERVTPSFSAAGEGWTVTAEPVEHSIETYAYRVDAADASVVYSGDTANPDPIVDFAADADVLVMNCGVAPEGASGTAADRESWRQYRATNPPIEETPIVDQHCTPTQAGETAAAADVGALVLTHLMPTRDIDAIREAAAATYDGDLRVAADGLTLSA